MEFTKATRKKAKLRLALTGPSGAGKTRGALILARQLGKKIACIDTEHGSASLYADLCDFDTVELTPPYTPERYIELIEKAATAGYDVLIIDSATHEWNGSGGILEMADDIARAKYRGNSYAAWNELTPRHRKFIDAILAAPMHVICTGRSKTETAQTEENGKKRVVKLGMKTEQREGFEYEMTVVLDLVHDGHFANPSKDRTRLFAGQDPKPITDETGKALLDWLNAGASMPEEQVLDHLCNIEGASDMLELRRAYNAAFKVAGAYHDDEASRRFEKAKDARKDALEPAGTSLGEQA